MILGRYIGAGQNVNRKVSVYDQLNVNGEIKALGAIWADNSDIYFSKIDHEHTKKANKPGHAAIENAADFNTLMILGRYTSSGRRVSVWDRLEVNGTFVNSSSRDTKCDIVELTNAEYEQMLAKLKKLPVFHYRLKKAGLDRKVRIGVIAEESPQEIVDETGKYINLSEYNAFLLAVLKAQQMRIEKLEKKLR